MKSNIIPVAGDNAQCPTHRTEILAATKSRAIEVARSLQRPWATASELSLFIGFKPQEIDQALQDALLPVVRLDGERAFLILPGRPSPDFQLVADFSPSATARGFHAFVVSTLSTDGSGLPLAADREAA